MVKRLLTRAMVSIARTDKLKRLLGSSATTLWYQFPPVIPFDDVLVLTGLRMLAALEVDGE